MRNHLNISGKECLSEITDQIIQKMINDKLSIGVKQTKYDTDKPTTGESGKHPVVEEFEIRINRETKIYNTDSICHRAERVSLNELKDKCYTLRTARKVK